MIWLPNRFFWWFVIVGPNTLASPGGQKPACVAVEAKLCMPNSEANRKA